MTLRSLFNIILKIIGLYFIKDILLALTQVIATFYYFIDSDSIREMGYTGLVVGLPSLLVYAFISWLLVFRSDYIIDKLKLNKGFGEEHITLNIHRSTILSIGIIVIGGLIVVDNIPDFCYELFNYLKYIRMRNNESLLDLMHNTRPDDILHRLIVIGVKIIIGLLLMGNQRRIVHFIEYRRKK